MIDLISTEGIFLSYITLSILYFVIWAWGLVDVLTTKGKGYGWLGLWAMVIIFAQPIGVFIYMFVGRKQGKGNINFIG